MQLTAQGVVTGVKKFVGNIDGNSINSGTVFVEMKLAGQDAKGIATQAYKCLNSQVIDRIFHLEPPYRADLLLEEVTNGKNASTKIVHDVRPIAAQSSTDAFIAQATAPAKPAAPAPGAAASSPAKAA